MGPGTGRAILIGALVGLLSVVAIVGVVALKVLPATADKDAAAGPILVAVVLPDDEGSPAVRALDVYTHSGDTLELTSLDPLAPATLPGTSATTLAEAYAFGGGDGLAKAYARRMQAETPEWIAVEQAALADMVGTTRLKVALSNDVEVFDGTEMYSFSAGSTSVDMAEVDHLMNGAAYLGTGERRALRMVLGNAVAEALISDFASQTAGIHTSIAQESRAAHFAGVKSTPLRADNNQ